MTHNIQDVIQTRDMVSMMLMVAAGSTIAYGKLWLVLSVGSALVVAGVMLHTATGELAND